MTPVSNLLEGRSIVVTRNRERAMKLGEAIEREGGEVLFVPVLKIEPPGSWDRCDECLHNLSSYNAVAFTSANGVTGLINRAVDISVSLDPLRRIRLYAVGEKTATALKKFGFEGAGVPATFSAAGLGNLFSRDAVQGCRFLLPQGNISRKELATHLTELGAIVDTVVVYRTIEVRPEETESLVAGLKRGTIDVVTFASPSAVRGFFRATRSERFFREGRQPVVATIGPTTSEEVRTFDVPVTIEASVSTMSGLVEAIIDYFRVRQDEE